MIFNQYLAISVIVVFIHRSIIYSNKKGTEIPLGTFNSYTLQSHLLSYLTIKEQWFQNETDKNANQMKTKQKDANQIETKQNKIKKKKRKAKAKAKQNTYTKVHVRTHTHKQVNKQSNKQKPQEQQEIWLPIRVTWKIVWFVLSRYYLKRFQMSLILASIS